jgi:hypothetical protein
MVGRVEIVLAVLLGLALLLGLGNQKQILQAKKQEIRDRKEVEILDARVREVNRTNVMNAFSASHAVMIKKIWMMERFRLVNPEIRSLSSDRAIHSEKEFLLEGNVTLLRKDDSVYEARKVRYDQKGKVLRSIGPFYAHRSEDYVRGYDFIYEVTPQRTRARKVFAHYLLREGGKELRKSAAEK